MMTGKGLSLEWLHSDFYIESPLIQSEPLSEKMGFPVFLKLENCQPTGSFKIRGLSRILLQIARDGTKEIVSSSGGNAGMAVAYVAKKLGLKAHLVVPNGTVSFMRQRLESLGAELHVYGDVWNESNEKALQLSQQLGCPYVHPADHPVIWEGHATMMSEIRDQLLPTGARPSAVVASVGAGGLICGILQGMSDNGWDDIPVVAMETLGAHSLNASVKAGQLVTLPEITSIAATLGSKVVIGKLMQHYVERGFIFSEVITDKEAVDACLHFADDHRMIIEPSCGASLAAVYSDVIHGLITDGCIKINGPLVIIVCGGGGVTLELLDKWKGMFLL